MEDSFGFVLLFLAGLLAGSLNVVAGGGSFLTLPILIFLGFPAVVANGTNRVGILFQNLGASWGFHRYRVLDWSAGLWAALPACLGSVLGATAALSVEDRLFRQLLALLMVVVTLWTLWDPLSRGRPHPKSINLRRLWLGVGFFAVGIYGGFVQAGVGFLVLAVTSLGGLDLVKGNAVKALSVLALTIISLGIFAWQDKVNWPAGLALATGTLLGGQLGIHLTVLKGHQWIRRVVTATVLIFAVKLLLG